MKRLIRFLERNVRLGSMTSTMTIIVIALLTASCDTSIQECFEVARIYANSK